MIFLQAGVAETSTKVILNYGAIGAMLILCLIGIVSMSKFFMKQDTKRQDDMRKLNEKMDRYIELDRKQMLDVITQNTMAFNNFISALEDIRQEIHYLKSNK